VHGEWREEKFLKGIVAGLTKRGYAFETNFKR